MFFNSESFKALEAGAQLSWMQQELRMQNIANQETPNYKAKHLQFDDVLQSVQNGTSVRANTLQARVVEDTATSSRPDGNNVDLETENLELYKAYAQYSMVLDKIKGQFTQYGYVLNSGMK